MADDLSSREILKQLVERLDLLERVLGRNTARLRNIEQHLGIELPQQALHESSPRERDEKHSATSGLETPSAISEVETHLVTAQVEMHLVTAQVETPDFDVSEASQSGPVPPQVPVTPEKWSQPETPPPGTPATHSWINEGSPSHTYATIEEALRGDRPVHVENDVTEDAGSQKLSP